MKMEQEITVDAYPSVYQKKEELIEWNTSEILHEIRNSSALKELVNQVRDISDKKERKCFKENNIPVFRPCFHNDKLTGLIQFDVDQYDQELSGKLKNLLIKKFPSLHYAFLSPSGGLKFALFTDLSLNSKDHFGIAYDLAVEKVRMVFGNGIKLDSTCRSAYLLCYFSHDPEAYINPTPDSLKIDSDVIEISLIRPAPAKTNSTKINTTDQDQDICLEAINAISNGEELQKKDRIKLSKAIKTVFGYKKAVEIILLELGYFKGDMKYLKSILRGDNQYNAGTIIHYARKCGFKGITKTFKENNLAGDHKRATFIENTDHKFERMDIQEASARIEKRVDQFLEERISIQLMVEMGAGKTRTTLQKLIEYMDARDPDEPPLKIAMFVPSHKLGKQSLEKLHEFEGELLCPAGSLGPRRKHKVIGGFTKYCKKLMDTPEEEKRGAIRNSWECEQCEYYDIQCWYINQFFFQDNLIRIYPHNYLFSPSKLDKDYKPDLVVTDEDPISHVIQEHIYESRDGKIWKIILNEGLDAVGSKDILKATKLLNLQIAGTTQKVEKGDTGSVPILNKLYDELEDIKLLKSILDQDGISEKGAVAVYSQQVHIARKVLPDQKWMKAPVLYLNGTGNNEITEAVFGKDKFKVTEEIRVKYNPNVKVIQVQNKSFSKSQVEDKDNPQTKNQLLDLVSYFYHYDKSCFISYQSFVNECLKDNEDYDSKRFMYFGDTRGKNDFEEHNVILVIGRQYLPRQAIALKGLILFGEELDTGTYNTTRTIELSDEDQNAQIDCQDFVNDRMKMLGRYFNEGETLQAINRLRLLHGNEKKTVIYLSNNVVDGLCVDELKIVDDVLVSEERMKLIKTVQAHGMIQGKPKVLAEACGLTAKQVSNLKGKKWFKDNLFFSVDDTKRLIDRFN